MCKTGQGAEETVFVCRCEEITREEILAAIQDGAATVTGVKVRTNAGMGLCQGRTCGKLIRQMLAQEAGIPQAQIMTGSSRAPVRTATISEFLNREEDV